MENFYDLNDFFAYIVRRLKFVIVIICIAVIGFAGVRFAGLYSDYSSQKNQAEQTQPQQTVSEPMKCWAEIDINVAPNYEIVGNTGMDRGKEIAYAYDAVRNSDEIMNTLHDKYFEQAKVYGDKMRELMIQFGYSLEKERNYEYVDYDFRRQFSVSITENYVTIGFYSLNVDFSKEVVAEYEKLLTAAVEKQYPGFEHSIVSESVRYELPETSAGASPVRNAGGQSTTSQKISFSSVIMQTVKGCFWGVVIGVVVSVVLLFLMYMMSRKLLGWQQLQFKNIRIYGLFYLKEGNVISRLLRKAVAFLEGNQTAFQDLNTLIDVILVDVHMRYPDERKIAVCSNSGSFASKTICRELNAGEGKERFVEIAPPLNSGKEYPADVTDVILIETIGKTVKSDMVKEIETFHDYGIEIVGVIGAE